jgi:peptide/nickel transport system substrate-binding protein
MHLVYSDASLNQDYPKPNKPLSTHFIVLRGEVEMNRKSIFLSFILVSVIFTLPSTSKGFSSQSLGPGKMTYVIAGSPGGPSTVDPALAYDTGSGELIQNVYDPLVFLNGTGSDVVPWLASSYYVSPDGQTYSFMIREGVQWQDAAYGTVTPADAEYSLKKVLVRDYTGGPAWMLWFPIFGRYAANLTDPLAQGITIDNAITSNATHVTIHFQTGKAYPPFLGILANTWGSIMSRQWCINHGDWNPDVDRLSDGTWVNAHDPVTSPLDSPISPSDPAMHHMMGSGPFKFNYLNTGVAWSILRNPNFWGGWGTSRTSLLGMPTTSRGYLDEIVEYFISDPATRIAGFTGTNPIYDSIAVPKSQMSLVWQQPGIKCQYPLPELSIDAMLFNYDAGITSPYIGTPTGYGYFGEAGITPDFFSDIHARKAVAYSFNWTQFISSAFMGEAEQNAIPVPDSFKFFNGSLPKYAINITRAIEEWQLAWGGQVWANGFRFSVVYGYYGNEVRQTAAQLIKAALEAENPKFHVDVISYAWDTYFYDPATMPIYIAGWVVDYPDVHDFAEPFMASKGYFGSMQHISEDPFSSEMDNLIEWGARNTTDVGRNANYQQLWNLYLQQVPSVPLEQPLGRRWARDWIHGWYFNPIFPGVYGYSLWKEDIHQASGPFAGTSANCEDINEDGKVDIKDIAMAAKAYGSYYIQPALPPYPVGTPGTYYLNWNSKADVNVVNISTGARGDMKIDIKDLAQIAKLYGFIADPWTPGP